MSQITVSRIAGLSVAAVVFPFLAGCGSLPTQERDWNAYDGPGKEHFLAEEVEFPTPDDPDESWNRPVSAFNYGMLVYVVDPAYQVWSSVAPEGVRDALGRAGTNLQYPRRALNDAFQGRGGDFGDETARFLLNTTVGLLGLFDPAKEWWDIQPPPNADFGQTFTEWGWKDPNYFNFPVIVTTTTRDALGRPLDMATEPLTYLTGATFFHRGNTQGGKVGAVKRFVAANPDPYEKGKVFASAARDAFVLGEPPEAEDEAPAADDTLKFVFLEPDDPEFVDTAEEREVAIDGKRKVTYSLWLQPEPAPLLYFVPGLGGFRVDSGTLALAEMAFAHGYSVASVSNPMNHEFMTQASSADVPGYAPIDADDMHAAFTAIDAELDRELGDRIGKRVLMGVSLGAFQTLYIAAAQVTPPDDRMHFDRFVAIHPPVSLRHGLDRLDTYYNSLLAVPEQARTERAKAIIRKAAGLLLGRPQPEDAERFSDLEARFLIGAAFRLQLGDVIVASQRRKDMHVLRTPLDTTRKTQLYREIREYSWIEYVYAFVLPSLKKRVPELGSVDEMFENCDLRSLAWRLGHCDNLRVLTAADDFLLADGDLDWLERTLPAGNLTVWEKGGHMGHLHEDDVQADIMASLWDVQFIE